MKHALGSSRDRDGDNRLHRGLIPRSVAGSLIPVRNVVKSQAIIIFAEFIHR
jgi:hypothetical protein